MCQADIISTCVSIILIYALFLRTTAVDVVCVWIMATFSNKQSKNKSGVNNAVTLEDGASFASSSDVGSAESDSSDQDHSVLNTESDASPFKEESRIIKRYKTITLIAILVTAVGCGIATYFIVAGRQKGDFQLKVSHILPRTTLQLISECLP